MTTTTTATSNGTYALNTAIGSLPVGTVLTQHPVATFSTLLVSDKNCFGHALYIDSGDCRVTFTPSKEKVAIPVDYEAFAKVVEASQEDLDNGLFSYGDKYCFYQIKDNTFRSAKMEKTSSDIGRMMSGFALPIDASPKKKFNRLTNLNKAYALGLSIEDIRDARDGVNK